ncbi:MAG: hypothetical protein ABWZ25_18115 [Chitinophagaceae bacterium]
MSEFNNDWKLNLRYGKTSTTFTHVTILAEGVVGKLQDGFSCRPGQAFMGMKAWVPSDDEAVDMIRSIGGQIGFDVSGKIEIYHTDPQEPPSESPSAYDIMFTPFD